MSAWCLEIWKILSDPKNIFSILDVVLVMIGVIIAALGLEKGSLAYKKYKETRRNDMWCFYAKFSILLDRLKKTIGKPDSYTYVVKYFYESIPEANPNSSDLASINDFKSLAHEFLDYLSTIGGQMPTITDLNGWTENRIVLIDFLQKVISIGVPRIIISENDLEPELDKISKIIDEMKEDMKNEISKLQEELKRDRRKVNKCK
jgi:hypothetical protein